LKSLFSLICISFFVCTYSYNQSAQELTDRCIIKKATGDYRGAIADCTKAIVLDPDCVYAFRFRGYSKYEIGDYQGAIADCTKAIEMDPNNATSFRYRGYSKHEIGDYKGAIADCTKAIELDPNSALTYFTEDFLN
jgi:tetratricopeptide (TPR) repeat protein